MAETTARIRASRPDILVGGNPEPGLSDGLLELRVEEHVHGLAHCALSVGNWGPVNGTPGFLYFDRRLLDLGKALAVRVGGEVVFEGRIGALEGAFPDGSPPALTVLAEDRFQDLRQTRRTRTFFDLSDADVFRQLASEHGLTPSVDLPGPSHRVLAQLNQSDLAFMRERARALDADLTLSDKDLTVRPRADAAGGNVLSYGSGLRELTVRSDLADQTTQVEVAGWDVAAKQGLRERADEAVVAGELRGAQSGAAALRATFGERAETVVNAVPMTTDEARAYAEARFRRRARRFLTARAVAEPDPALRAGATVDVKGVGPLFEGEYYVVEARHLFDGAHGLRTELALERAGWGTQ
jgi:phage protein D